MEAATGQVILAHLPREHRQRVLAEWKRETGRDIPGDLQGHLDRIRRRGNEKRASYQIKGVTNISVPIMGEGNRAVAALTVPFIQRLPPSIRIEEAEALLVKVCREISAVIGAKPTADALTKRKR